MERLFQALLIVGTLGASWLGMMAVHESGHIVAALAAGGSIKSVALPIFGFWRTDLANNPHPLVVAWAGGVLGSLFPLPLLLVTRLAARRFAFLAQFFAGFCLIANGAYLGGGAWLDAGDAADLLHHGAQRWQLATFGLPIVAAGLALWNGLGRHFGLGSSAGRVDHAAAAVAAACASPVCCST